MFAFLFSPCCGRGDGGRDGDGCLHGGEGDGLNGRPCCGIDRPRGVMLNPRFMLLFFSWRSAIARSARRGDKGLR